MRSPLPGAVPNGGACPRLCISKRVARTVKGQFAVAEVILNRVESARFPDSICGVINQGTGPSVPVPVHLYLRRLQGRDW